MRIKVDDPPSGHIVLFAADDILRCKVLTTDAPPVLVDNWLVVEYALDPRTHGYPDADYWEYEAVLESGTPGLLPAGAAIVNYGQSGDGYVKLTSDEADAPYLDIATHAGAPWTTITTHVRIGNLDGVLGPGAEWGMAAGTDLSDDTLPHVIVSDQQVGLWGVEQTWWDSAGNARGKVDPSAGPADVLFWLGPSEAGAHFKVLGSGDVWLDTLAISDDLGDFLFSQADGLLLLGPNCEINAAEWWSLRRQKATISGAFHQEAGRWLGTRALVVERGTTNLLKNASFEYATLATYWPTTGGTPSRTTGFSKHGEASLQLDATWEGVKQNVTVAATTTHHFSVWARKPSGTGTTQVRLGVYKQSDNAAIVTANHNIGAQWARYTVELPDTNTETAVYVKIVITGTYTNAVCVDCAQLESRGFETSWCNYDLGSGYSGAIDTTSVRAATTVLTPTSGSIEAAEGYIAMWFKVPVWNTENNMRLWSAGDVNSEFDAYISSVGTLFYRINGATRCESAIGAATEDVWHLAVFNWKVGTDVSELYLDGELIDTGIVDGAPTPNTNLGIGYGSPVGTNYDLGGSVGEFATGGTVLTTSQVAALYALQRPLVDAGSMDTPGIYILDGKFRMASSLTGARMDLDVAGLTFKDGSGNTLVDLDATDASFTLKSATSGARIEIDPTEIAGYNSGGAKQFYLQSSDGKAYLAGGDIVLDDTGITQQVSNPVVPSYMRWMYDGADRVELWSHYIGTWGSATEIQTWLWARGHEAGDAPESKIYLRVRNYDDTKNLQVLLDSTDEKMTISADGGVEITGGGLVAAGSVVADTLVQAATLFRLTELTDPGGADGTFTYTPYRVGGGDTGTLNVDLRTNNAPGITSGYIDGFLKLYVGTTPLYIPYFFGG